MKTGQFPSPAMDLHQVGCLAPLGGAPVCSPRMSPSHLRAPTTTVFFFRGETRGGRARGRSRGGPRLPPPPGTAAMMPRAPSAAPCLTWTSTLPWQSLPPSTLGITKQSVLLLVPQNSELVWTISLCLFLRGASAGVPVSEMIQHTAVRRKKSKSHHFFTPEEEVTNLISKQSFYLHVLNIFMEFKAEAPM